MIRIVTLFLFLVSFHFAAQAQTDSLVMPTHKIWLRDGNRFLGKILYEDDDSMRVQTQEYVLMHLDVDKVRRVIAVKKRDLNPDGTIKSYSFPQQDFAGQTGFGPEKGAVSYRNAWLLANDIEVGITDHISIQGGFAWTVIFVDGEGPAWITPKVHFPIVKDVVHTSLSYFRFRYFGAYSDEKVWASFLQSATSVQLKKSQITVGVAVGKRYDYEAAIPAFLFSGQFQLGRNTQLITENYLVRSAWGQYGAGSIGFRLGRRAKFDLGLGYVIDEYQYVNPVPIAQFRMGF